MPPLIEQRQVFVHLDSEDAGGNSLRISAGVDNFMFCRSMCDGSLNRKTNTQERACPFAATACHEPSTHKVNGIAVRVCTSLISSCCERSHYYVEQESININVHFPTVWHAPHA